MGGWFNIDSGQRPENGQTIIVALFYDWWRYDIGHYVKDTDEFVSETSGIISKFDCYERWSPFNEPSK